MILPAENSVRQHLSAHDEPFTFSGLVKDVKGSKSDVRKVIEKLMRLKEIRNTVAKGQGNYGVYVKTKLFVPFTESASAYDEGIARQLSDVLLKWGSK